MADTIKLPGVGPVQKKWVYVGGAAIAGIVGYAYWTSSRNQEVDTADYTTDETDYAMDGGVDEYVNPGGTDTTEDEDYITAPTTNAEWSQKAYTLLTDAGYDYIATSVALGRYFARLDLTVVQADMIRAAVGSLGPPPVGTYPIDTTPTPATPKLTAPTGLSAHDIGSTTAGFIWNAVTGARWYELSRSGRSATYNTASTHVSMTGLKRNTSYTVKVRAVDMDKKPGPWSASRTFRTKK
jgi:hypothetical protein